jgi:hypothetical protein
VHGFIQYSGDGHTTGFNALAADENELFEFHTVPMRNQAQTHQLELVGTNSFVFALGFRAEPSDWDGDGLPNIYEDGFPFLDSVNPADGPVDQDGDFVSNTDEYIMGTAPNDANAFLRATTHAMGATGIVVRFPSVVNREYTVGYGDDLGGGIWQVATTNAIPGTGSVIEWVDDGTLTTPAPQDATNRIYRIEVGLPQ